jgi:hypothetical protein
VDAEATQADFSFVLVKDHDRLSSRHVQAAANSVKRDRCSALQPVQDQALIGRDPQLAGMGIVTLPEHGTSLVQA